MSKKRPKRLGKGLQALLSSVEPQWEDRGREEPPISSNPLSGSVQQASDRRSPFQILSIDQIRPNPHQPRQTMSDSTLQDLASSIATSGVIQPIVVRRQNGQFELVAGERRWRAARMAGLNELPVIVRDVEDRQMLELALVENIQREDLNPIDRGKAYQQYIRQMDITQEDAAKRLGQDRTTIANYMRLLDLCDDVREILLTGALSMGHARTLVPITDPQSQLDFARRCIRQGMSVRQLEKLIKRSRDKGEPRSSDKAAEKSANTRELEATLSRKLGTKVIIDTDRTRSKGKVIVEFYSLDDFDRIYHLLQGEKGLNS